MKYKNVSNFIYGQFMESSSQNFLEVISPVDGNLLSKVCLSTSKDLDDAVKAAKKAFPIWSKTSIKESKPRSLMPYGTCTVKRCCVYGSI
jgi:malonate-semialdehyde dehydrogenase (acetylating)/methylmalonate-semialdehyde dehydrogenase